MFSRYWEIPLGWLLYSRLSPRTAVKPAAILSRPMQG